MVSPGAGCQTHIPHFWYYLSPLTVGVQLLLYTRKPELWPEDAFLLGGPIPCLKFLPQHFYFSQTSKYFSLHLTVLSMNSNLSSCLYNVLIGIDHVQSLYRACDEAYHTEGSGFDCQCYVHMYVMSWFSFVIEKFLTLSF